VEEEMSFQIGDRVTWTHSRQQGRSIVFTLREAKVIHATERNITVKFRGKIINLPPERFRKYGQQTELTEMVMGKI
jgi:hypothetical protein